ncbi:MAG TPA: ribonuclease HII [Cytophagaceae bacterium]|jgi:ribonuclease HII|nr:ribonuclease HII [Cytophagaceae bacterium]
MLKSSFTKDKVEAGLDEAGRGCLAGPVVAAAVILPKGYKHKGLNDSKKLTAKQREELRIDIERDALCFAVAEVSEKIIDEINILNASFRAMHDALDKLHTQPELLLIDGNRFKKYKEIPHECVIQGDGLYLAIAAASILAKTYRDDLMTRLAVEYPQYGWEHNMGYATEFHRTSIEKYGYSPLHRLSFNVKSSQLEIF